METPFFVIDHEGQISWNARTERPESFKTHAAATKRAKELAAREPGHQVSVVAVVEVVACEISKPKSVMTRTVS
jgi:hypothetical protein